MKPLTPQRQRFVDEYVIDLNATQAAIRASYSPRSARSQASELLTIPNIQQAIAEAQAKRSKETKADEAYITRGLMNEVETLNPDSGSNRIRAYDLLARLGGYPAPGKTDVPDTRELRTYSIPELMAIVAAFRAGEARALPEGDVIDGEVREITNGSE